MDAVFDAAESVGLDPVAATSGWRRTRRAVGPVLQQGMHYALEAQRAAFVHPSRMPAAAAASTRRSTRSTAAVAQALAAAAAAAPSSSLQWLAAEIGIAGVSQDRTPDVVKLLVARPELLHDPRELSRASSSCARSHSPSRSSLARCDRRRC